MGVIFFPLPLPALAVDDAFEKLHKIIFLGGFYKIEAFFEYRKFSNLDVSFIRIPEIINYL